MLLKMLTEDVDDDDDEDDEQHGDVQHYDDEDEEDFDDGPSVICKPSVGLVRGASGFQSAEFKHICSIIMF